MRKWIVNLNDMTCYGVHANGTKSYYEIMYEEDTGVLYARWSRSDWIVVANIGFIKAFMDELEDRTINDILLSENLS